MPNITWVDTGFLVALFANNDKHHASAKTFLAKHRTIELHTIWPVVVEACFFLDSNGKQALLTWLERGSVTMHEITSRDIPLIRQVLANYNNLEPDFTDAAIVALADSHRIYTILTVDVRDFSVYRFSNGAAFERLWI